MPTGEQIPETLFAKLGEDRIAYQVFGDGDLDLTEPDRALAAILHTDIVGSTERVSAMGDREWRNLLDTHDAVARTVVERTVAVSSRRPVTASSPPSTAPVGPFAAPSP
jgi:class 3 adenylate cyclase